MRRRTPDIARRRLFKIADTQAGHFTATQALKAGYSWRLQHYHVDRGHWTRVERGVFRLVEYPADRLEELVRWSLWARGQAVVSHECAAYLHELGDILPSRVHLTFATPQRRRVPKCVVIHVSKLAPDESIEGGGFRVTTPLRTIIDLTTSFLEGDWLAGVIASALKTGGVERKRLEGRLGALDESARKHGLRALSQAMATIK